MHEFDLNNFYKNFVKEEYDKDGHITKFELDTPPNYNFAYDVIDRLAKEVPDKVAIHWLHEEGEEKIFTYRDLSKLTNKVANMFRDHGVKKGDMVLLVLKRNYQFWLCVYGLIKLGAIGIPATNQLLEKDYTYRFEAASVKYVVATGDGEVADHIDGACKKYDGIIEKFITRHPREGWTDFDTEIEKYSDELERVDTLVDEPMLLYFSSGTTGYPKMILHSHYLSAAHIMTAKHWHHVHDGTLHLTVSDTGWGKCAWGKLFGQYTCGATEFIYDFDRFNSAKLLSIIEKYKITSFCAPPTMYRFFIKEGIENYDLSSLEYACIAGEALNSEVFNRFYEYTGLKLMEAFGQTESVPIVANLYGMEPKPGSMGKPVPLYDVVLADSDGNEVQCGEVGEICIRTEGQYHKGLMKCYYRNEEDNNASWHDGLYHTGDTAWKDEDGYFWYVGRTDDVIKSSGYRIGPFEIESVLMEHPSVLECAVTAVKDPIRGQAVKATIVLTKNFKPSDELVKELQNYVKHATAPYKYPRVIEFVDELPKTISGKIIRKEIRRLDELKGM